MMTTTGRSPLLWLLEPPHVRLFLIFLAIIGLIIVPMSRRAADEMGATIDVYRWYAGDEQVRPYADAVGQVFFAIDTVLRPIISEYPDLHP